MSNFDLKAYTAKAVELETAIYTQKKLMKEHNEKIQKQLPTAPIEDLLEKPSMSNINDYMN